MLYVDKLVVEMFKSFCLIFILVQLLACNSTKYNAKSEDSKIINDEDKVKNLDTEKLRFKELTLLKSLKLALDNNPDLKIYRWKLKENDADILQNNAYPNPELGIEAGNILGSGQYSGFDSSEITLFINQPIILGSKKDKKNKIYEIERKIISWDLEIKKLALFRKISKAFLNLLKVQEELKLYKEYNDLSRQISYVKSRKSHAGKISKLEEKESQYNYTYGSMNIVENKILYNKHKSDLTSFIGMKNLVFQQVVGSLEKVSPPPSPEKLISFISKNPEITKWTLNILKNKAVIISEESKLLPDLSVSTGLKVFNDTGDIAFNLGVSILLPIFDRNQGEIEKSEYIEKKSAEQKKAKSLEILFTLIRNYERLTTLYEKIEIYRKDIFPQAKYILSKRERGYDKRKYELDEFLIARRSFVLTKHTYLALLLEYQDTVLDIETLLGVRLKNIN